MELICTMGSISCDGVLAEKGDIFVVGDKAGKSLIASGYAREYFEPIANEPAVMSEDAIPDESWIIADIKIWLDDRDREYPDRAAKAELLSLVDQGE